MGNFCTEKYHLFLLSLHFCRLRSSAWAHSEFTCICWPRIRAVELSWVGFMFLHSTLCVCVCFILSITRFPTPDRMRFLLFIRPQNLRGYAAQLLAALLCFIVFSIFSIQFQALSTYLFPSLFSFWWKCNFQLINTFLFWKIILGNTLLVSFPEPSCYL